MVIALDLAQARRTRIWAVASPMAELMASLHVLAEPDHHPESRRWIDETVACLSDDLRARLHEWAPLWARYRMRLFYPVCGEESRSLASELEQFAGVDDDVFVPMCANAIRGLSMPLTAASEVRRSRRWVTECEHRSFVRGELAHRLVADPARFRADLVGVLEAAAREFFDRQWEASGPALESAAASARRRIQTVEPPELVASLSPMASRRESASTVYFDKLQSKQVAVGPEGLVVVPSIRSWPHVMVKFDAGIPIVVQYLVREAGREDLETQSQLRRKLFVLAEPGRWELCRHLIGESITTTELARRTGTSKHSVSRHLRALREAGLISSQREGRQVFHRLHPATVIRLGQDVLSAMLR